MKQLLSNYVYNISIKFPNIRHNSRFYSRKLSRSTSECLDHISQIKSSNDMMFEP